jgi:two-component system response regulator DesR
MDIGLPGMNGIEATRIIKQMSGRTRVVMHTTSDMPIYREEAAAAGADAFVGKAKNAADLLSIISSFLR